MNQVILGNTLSTNLPLVSIVVPAYNHARYLVEAIDSILNQDYSHLELIVLDDGSTDDTHKILESYGNRFYWESQENIGQSNTLNKGWNMANGDILAYLSADDVLCPQATSIAVNCLLENNNAVLCYCDFQLIDSDSKVIRRVVAPQYSYHEMVTRFIAAPGPGAYFKRSAYTKTDGWDSSFRQYPDYEYWLRLGLLGDFIPIHEQLAKFRVHEGSQSFAKTTVKHSEEALRVMHKYFLLPNIPSDILAVENSIMANALLIVAQLHLRSGRYILGFQRIYNAFLKSPRVLFSQRGLRVLANGFFNRLGHKLWQFIRNIFTTNN